jgi:hypothetical protein
VSGGTPPLAHSFPDPKPRSKRSQASSTGGEYPSYGDPGMDAAWFAAPRAMSQEDRAEATMPFAGRQGIRTSLHFSDLVTATPPSTVTYPDTTLAARLDGALDAFLEELAGLGMTQQVLVATQSEFGRRADQNSSGLGHGSASVGMFCGGFHAGVYGTHPNWKTLDTNDNLEATVAMGEYLATQANWLGVAPGDVLSGNPAPLAGVTL